MPKKKAYIYVYDKLKKAEKDERKKKEEIEREQTLKDYRDAFELDEEVNSDVLFVRGGVYDVNNKEDIIDDSRGNIYYFKEQEKTIPKEKSIKKTKIISNGEVIASSRHNPKTIIKEKKKNIDIFLEEVQNLQKDEEIRKNQTTNFLNRKLKATDKFINSIRVDSDNSTNSNLYLGNLSHLVTEEMLMSLFAKYGEIESIKIIKNDDKSMKNIAFICFKTPVSAHTAKIELNDYELYGNALKIGWGKKFYTTNKINQIQAENHSSRQHIFVKIPDSELTRRIIDEFSKHVADEGYAFEQFFLEKERNNKDFNFISQKGTSENNYYKWRVYSFLQGDLEKSWRTEPFEMTRNGNIWHPPTIESSIIKPSITVIYKGNFDVLPTEILKETQLSNNKSNENNGVETLQLPSMKKSELDTLLSAISLKKRSICQSMVFALDNVEYHSEILKFITERIDKDNYTEQVIIEILLIKY